MPRPPIQQLPPGLVNRIAAGEVIERPASVVKELVDNAVDAGATSVTVEIEDGGRELIRVIDDGHGIPPDELPLAFAAHATSKLRGDDDLFAITTMGFRGEALASIGSVAHARVLSRTPGRDTAFESHNRGGELSPTNAAAGPVGTTIDVRHLFFNVPARRKFLKGVNTEFGHVADMLLRLALPRPDVAFRLVHGGRVVREYVAAAAGVRWLTAWPADFAGRCLPVDVRDNDVLLGGLVGLPELAAPTPKHQYLYVNRRPVRDRTIQAALREAFRGLTEPGRHPAAVLMLDLPPGDVDVNVHPTKSEVRFRDGGRIYSLVHSAVREILAGHDLTPNAVASPVASAAGVERVTMQQRLADFFRTPAPAQATFETPGDTLPLPVWPGEGGGEGRTSNEGPSFAPTSAPKGLLTAEAPPASTPAAVAGPHPNPLPAVPGEGTRPAADGPRRPAIQLHNSYLVVESDEGMLVIDQHALHERIIFEDLLAKLSRGPLESQRMLIPVTVKASAQQVDLIGPLRSMLAKLGIEAEAFGPDAVAVHAFPSFLDRLDPAVFVGELLDKAEADEANPEALLHDVLDMMSCKAAVKAGDPLTGPEIDALLARRASADRSSNCPHGRPTTLRLSLADLEKQFKRTGF